MTNRIKSGQGKWGRMFSWRHLTPQKILSYLKYYNWLRLKPEEMPLYSKLDEELELPNLHDITILWPDRYSYIYGYNKLEVIKTSFSKLVSVVTYEAGDDPLDWRNHGGFPVPVDQGSLIGQPCFPKNRHDIRGEIFQIQINGQVLNCAFDYSDYPVISTDILSEVDLYYKCIVPLGPLLPKVVGVGYFARQTDMLAKARSYVLKKQRERDIDVYGRFGSWTDSQEYRKRIIDKLINSSLNFVGGFGEMKTYSSYLDELGRAKIAIELPGQGPISYRFIEAMAMGALIVCRKPQCVFPEELIDGMHYVSIKDDASDLVLICREMLEDSHRRQVIVHHAMSFYDRNFSPQSMVRRMLRAAARLVAH